MTQLIAKVLFVVALFSTHAGLLAQELAAGKAAPVADHHRHLFSPGIEALLAKATGGPKAVTARCGAIRQVGIERITVWFGRGNRSTLRPREGWEAFRQLPLGEQEFAVIAANVAPYLR